MESWRTKALKVMLFALVIVHIMIVIGNLAALGFLPFTTPWYISLPLCSFLVRLALVEANCPLTILENHLREKLGYKKIRTFIGHYFVKVFFILKNNMD